MPEPWWAKTRFPSSDTRAQTLIKLLCRLHNRVKVLETIVDTYELETFLDASLAARWSRTLREAGARGLVLSIARTAFETVPNLRSLMCERCAIAEHWVAKVALDETDLDLQWLLASGATLEKARASALKGALADLVREVLRARGATGRDKTGIIPWRERPELELDRSTQREALRLPFSTTVDPLLVVVVDGEEDQGHAPLTDVACSLLPATVRRLGAHTEDPGGPFLEWPSAWPPGSRLDHVLRQLASVLDVERAFPTVDPLAEPDTWAELIVALQHAITAHCSARSIVLRHTMRANEGDAAVLRAYLERVWIPCAALLADTNELKIVLIFETSRTRGGARPRWNRAWKRQRGAVSRMRKMLGELERDAHGVWCLEPPELLHVRREELHTFLKARTKMPPANLAAVAGELLEASEDGRFDSLVRGILRTGLLARHVTSRS